MSLKTKKRPRYNKVAITVSMRKAVAPVSPDDIPTKLSIFQFIMLIVAYSIALNALFVIRGLIGLLTLGMFNPKWLNAPVMDISNKMIDCRGSYSNIVSSKGVRNVRDNGSEKAVG